MEHSPMRHVDKQMPAEQAEELLQQGQTAHVATVGPDGWPYVIPLGYVYPRAGLLYFHTDSRHGHLGRNLAADPRVCIQVEVPLQPAQVRPNSLGIGSVVAFGTASPLTGGADKAWFLMELLRRYGKPAPVIAADDPWLTDLAVYVMKLEHMAGRLA